MIGHLGVWLAQWQALGLAELANVAGLFVAVIGIGFTLGQLVLLRRQLKLDALIRIMDSNRAIVALSFEHPAVWLALDSEAPTTGASDSLLQRHYLQLWVNHMLVMWMAWRLGLVAGLEWVAYREDMADFLRSPSLQAHWTRAARFYPRDFQRLIAGLLPSGLPAAEPASAGKG